MLFFAGIVLAAAWVSSPAEAAAMPNCNTSSPPPVAPILPGSNEGWNPSYRLENSFLRAVIVPSIGRLVFFGPPDGPNALRIDPNLRGKSPDAEDRFFNVGGNWVWPVAQSRWKDISPDGADWPPPAPLADRPWNASAWTDAEGAQCGLLSREYGAPIFVKVSRLFRLDPESDFLVVRQCIERTAPSVVPVSLWTISQTDWADQIALPVDPSSKFPRGIATLIGNDSPGQLSLFGDVAVFQSASPGETKLGSDSARGWIAAARGSNVLLMALLGPSAPKNSSFPDGGCVVELFANPKLRYSEIETLGPELDLAPGTVVENSFRLSLHALPGIVDAESFASQMRAILAQ